MSDPTALRVDDLHKSFGAHKVIVGVSMEAQPGDVYLAGEKIRMKQNRLGKSVPEDTGQVERMCARFAMVFQGFNPWSHMTVMENELERPLDVQKIPKAKARAVGTTSTRFIEQTSRTHSNFSI